MVVDWVRVLVRSSLRGGMESVDWRRLRRDLRVDGGRVWGIWMVVGGWVSLTPLGIVGFGFVVGTGNGEVRSRLAMEDGTWILEGVVDIV